MDEVETGVNISPEELRDAIDRGTAPPILDVRSEEEYRSGHVPEAIHLPFWKVASYRDRLPDARDARLVVYCGHGPRAWLAARALRRLGYTNLIYLRGHMAGWRARRMPEDAQPGADP